MRQLAFHFFLDEIGPADEIGAVVWWAGVELGNEIVDFSCGIVR